MARDLSLKAIHINGHRVRCSVCKRHDAVERFLGVLVCRQCLRPMAMGFFIGRVYEGDKKKQEGSE